MLLDIHMPNKNGYEVLEEIRDNPTLEASQIIVFTGSKVDQILCEPYGDIIAGFAEKQDQDEELTDLMRLIKLQLAILKWRVNFEDSLGIPAGIFAGFFLTSFPTVLVIIFNNQYSLLLGFSCSS